MIKFSCEKCQKPLQGKDDLLNKTIRCPKCKQPTKVLAKTNPVKQGELEDLAAQALIEEQDDKKEAQKTVKFTCFFCDSEIEVSVEFAGKQAPCPECRRITKVPGVAKNETKDWRKAGEKKKLLVEQQRQEELEGEWGTRTAGGKVSRDALIEAKVVKEERPKLTVGQWIKRGSAAVLGLAVLITGGWLLFNFLFGQAEHRAIALAKEAVGSSSSLAPAHAAFLQLGLAEYTKMGPPVEPDEPGVLQYLISARQAAQRVGDLTEKSFVLHEVLQAQIRFGNLNEDKQLEETLNALREMPAGPFRDEAIRELARAGIAQGWLEKFQRLLGRAISQGGSAGGGQGSAQLVAAFAQVGLELVRAGRNEQAAALLAQMQSLNPPDRAWHESLLALNYALKMPDPPGQQDTNKSAMGNFLAHLAHQEWDAARQVLADPLKAESRYRLTALVRFGEGLIESGQAAQAGPLLAQAGEMAALRFPNEAEWAKLKVIQLAVMANGAVADQFLSKPNYLNPVLLDLGRLSKLQQSGLGGDLSLLQAFNRQSAGFAAAVIALARNDRSGVALEWADEESNQGIRPLIGIGVALGFRSAAGNQ